MGLQGVRSTKRPILVPTRSSELSVIQSTQASPRCPAGGDYELPGGVVWAVGEICTHRHSRAGFRSRSGWEDRSWWWSPGAGNLSDNGRARCFQPEDEVPTITFHPATLHTCHLTAYLPTTLLLPTLLFLYLIKSYLSLEAAYIMPLPQGLTQFPGPDQHSHGIYHILLRGAECLTQNQKTLGLSSSIYIYSLDARLHENLYTLAFLCRAGMSSPATLHWNVVTLKCEGRFESVL